LKSKNEELNEKIIASENNLVSIEDVGARHEEAIARITEEHRNTIGRHMSRAQL